MRNLHLSAFFTSSDFRISDYLKGSFLLLIALVFFFSSDLFQFSVRASDAVNSSSKGGINQSKKIQNTSGEFLRSGKSKNRANFEAFLIQTSNQTGNIFFVAPNGTASGNGSINSPWDLKTAFNHPAAVKPGDTIYLRGGKYNVSTVDLGFTSTLKGTPENPIKVMSRPGEWAVVDGNLSNSPQKRVPILTIRSNYTWYQGFEIMNTETGNRKLDTADGNSPEVRGPAVSDLGLGTKLINLVIHDAGIGISSYSGGRNAEYYGNIVYNNGWDAPDRLHGQGNYTQNNSDYKRFEENIFFNGFGNNSQMYGSSAAFLRNFTWIGNIMFNGTMAWRGPALQNLTVKENHFYKQQFALNPNMQATNTDANIQNNYFMDGAVIGEFMKNMTFTGNTVWNTGTGTLIDLQTMSFWTPSRFTFSCNTYYKTKRHVSSGLFRVYYINKSRDFAFNDKAEPQRYEAVKKSWQDDLGLDKNSVFIDSAPTDRKVFVRPNKYDSGRAHIIIYNWNEANTVEVNVSSILKPGDRYELRNVQDYFGGITTGTYSGGRIKVNMTGRSLAKPIGYEQVSSWYHDPLDPSTFPTFGVFVLIKTNK